MQYKDSVYKSGQRGPPYRSEYANFTNENTGILFFKIYSYRWGEVAQWVGALASKAIGWPARAPSKIHVNKL